MSVEKKFSLRLDKQDAETLTEISRDQQISITAAVRKTIRLYKFLCDHQKRGNTVIVRIDGYDNRVVFHV